MILLFTSSNKELYKRDLLNICCEASGTHVQFAYKYEWIPAELQSGNEMTGQDVLVVFCEPFSKQPPYYRFHPIRLGKIVGAPHTEYESLNITFALGGFFSYKGYAAQDFIEWFQNYILRSAQNPGNKDKPRCWVRKEENLLDGDGANRPDPWLPCKSDFLDTEWLPLIGHFRTREGLKDATFFSIQKQDSFGGAPACLFSVAPKYVSGSATYTVKGGSRHTLVLHIPFIRSDAYPKPELKLEENVASVSGPFLRQRSDGLQADFEVVFKRSFQQQMSMLELRASGGDAESDKLVLPGGSAASPDKTVSPEFQALIIVGVPWGLLLLAVALLAFGAIVAVTEPEHINQLAETPGFASTWLGDLVKDHKVLTFFVVKGLAFFAIGGGTFLGFNKLPFGGE